MTDSIHFDPSKYLTKVGGSDYLEVKWRLVWLRQRHPDAVIETTLVEHSGDAAVFRAMVSVPDGGSASGWGSESMSDFRDYIEKAETKAIGRALAALGFGTQFAPEFDEGERIVDAPQAPRTRPQLGPGTRAPANERRSPQSAPEPLIDRDKVIQRMHSYVPHDALHNWAVANGFTSLADVSTDDLIILGKSFKDGGATPFMAQYAPPAGQSSIDGLDDLHAQLDRDRIADRARQ